MLLIKGLTKLLTKEQKGEKIEFNNSINVLFMFNNTRGVVDGRIITQTLQERKKMNLGCEKLQPFLSDNSFDDEFGQFFL